MRTLSAVSGDQLSIANRQHQKRSIRPKLPKRSDSRLGVFVLYSISRGAPTDPPRLRPTCDQVTLAPSTGPPFTCTQGPVGPHRQTGHHMSTSCYCIVTYFSYIPQGAAFFINASLRGLHIYIYILP